MQENGSYRRKEKNLPEYSGRLYCKGGIRVNLPKHPAVPDSFGNLL
ncbi:hypothetical protein CHFL109739_10755 [Chryseobacterium flavum]